MTNSYNFFLFGIKNLVKFSSNLIVDMHSFSKQNKIFSICIVMWYYQLINDVNRLRRIILQNS